MSRLFCLFFKHLVQDVVHFEVVEIHLFFVSIGYGNFDFLFGFFLFDGLSCVVIFRAVGRLFFVLLLRIFVFFAVLLDSCFVDFHARCIIYRGFFFDCKELLCQLFYRGCGCFGVRNLFVFYVCRSRVFVLLFGHSVFYLDVFDDFVGVVEFGMRNAFFAQSSDDNRAYNENADYDCQ